MTASIHSFLGRSTSAVQPPCGARRKTPFSAANHTGKSPNMASSLARSEPEKMTTTVEGSAESAASDALVAAATTAGRRASNT